MNLLNLAPALQATGLFLPKIVAGRDRHTERRLRGIAQGAAGGGKKGRGGERTGGVGYDGAPRARRGGGMRMKSQGMDPRAGTESNHAYPVA